MAWRRPGDKPLSEPIMIRLPTHICVIRPQWVNQQNESLRNATLRRLVMVPYDGEIYVIFSANNIYTPNIDLTRLRFIITAVCCLIRRIWRNPCYLFQPLQLLQDMWPSQIVFDPRPCQEHVAYVIMSPRSSYDFSKTQRQGPLHRYDVKAEQLLEIWPSVCFIHCLQNGRQLLVTEGDDHDDGCQSWHIKVLDTVTFSLIFKVDGHLIPLTDEYIKTKAFYSADYKKLAFLAWHDHDSRPTDVFVKAPTTSVFVMRLCVGETCLSLMTLKEICRVTILKFPSVRRMAYDTLPDPWTDFLSGL